ncbi:unnamed protein product, partial [Allacma fusca]
SSNTFAVLKRCLSYTHPTETFPRLPRIADYSMNSAVYKNVLRVLESWPLDPTKKSRDFGEFIRQQVLKNFGGAAASQVNSNCWEDISNRLQRISSDHYKRTFSVSQAKSATGLSEQECHQAISNDFLAYLQEEDKSVISRVKGKFKISQSS